MGNLTGSSTAEIDAPIGRVWELVEDVEAAPSWQGGLKSLRAVERDGDGRAVLCESESDAKVRTIKSVRQKVSSLSGGQRQTVAIARSVLQQARLVILDEPTAALGVAQTEQVLQLVRRLADSGVGVIIISHNLADVFEVADFIDVLYLGQMVASLDAKQTSRDEVVGYITGTKIRDQLVEETVGHHLVHEQGASAG